MPLVCIFCSSLSWALTLSIIEPKRVHMKMKYIFWSHDVESVLFYLYSEKKTTKPGQTVMNLNLE